MSRFVEWDGDESYPNQWAMWEGRVKMALNSKRGRAALAELREALVALPAPRLIENAICRPVRETPVSPVTGGEVCVIGAYLWHQKVKAGMDPVEAFASLPTVEGGTSADDEGYDDDYYGEAAGETARLGRDAGLTHTLAYELAYMNDETYEGLDPEQRHSKFIAWIDSMLAKPLLTRPPARPKRVKAVRSVSPARRAGQATSAQPPTIPMGL